jgi:hypothetical protein
MTMNLRTFEGMVADRLLGVIAMFLAVSFTFAIPFEGGNALAQSQRDGKVEARVDGKLTIDGKATELRYAYARKREFRPPAPQGLIDLLVTNQPLSEEALTRILEVKYDGSDKIRSIWMCFDASGAYKGERLLLQSGSVPAATGVIMSMMQGTGKTRIENGRINGSLEANINSPTRSTTFAVSFDVPLKPRFAETAKTPVNPGQFLKDFQSVMPGNWKIERWKNDRGEFYTGTLSVHERLGEETFRGTLHLVVDTNGSAFDEEVTITREGAKVHFNGRVAPDAKYLPDILTFDLKNDLLVGGGTDTGGFLMDVVLRKIR